jgi:hypothetical protein
MHGSSGNGEWMLSSEKGTVAPLACNFLLHHQFELITIVPESDSPGSRKHFRLEK